MVIPAIDFQGGRVVQLVQGERPALTRELEPMLEEFRGFPLLQIIDLDAAKGEGNNRDLVRRCCNAGYRVRVGGGIRSRARAEEVLGWGAEQIIVSSAVFGPAGLNPEFLPALVDLGRERLLVAVDARQGRVAVHGWRTLLPLSPLEAMRQAEPYCGEFLYTHVDTEGLMGGIPLETIRALRAGTGRTLSVAGGISSLAEIEQLEAMPCHSVLGMAIYTGKLSLAALRRFAGEAGHNSEREGTIP